MAEELQPDVMHDPLPHELEEPYLQVAEKRFADDEEQVPEGEKRQTRHFAGNDMPVDGNLYQPRLGQCRPGNQRQQCEDRNCLPPVGGKIAVKPTHQKPVEGPADYLIFMDAAEMHGTPFWRRAQG